MRSNRSSSSMSRRPWCGGSRSIGRASATRSTTGFGPLSSTACVLPMRRRTCRSSSSVAPVRASAPATTCPLRTTRRRAARFAGMRRATEALLTGDSMTGDEAVLAGFANHASRPSASTTRWRPSPGGSPRSPPTCWRSTSGSCTGRWPVCVTAQRTGSLCGGTESSISQGRGGDAGRDGLPDLLLGGEVLTERGRDPGRRRARQRRGRLRRAIHVTGMVCRWRDGRAA